MSVSAKADWSTVYAQRVDSYRRLAEGSRDRLGRACFTAGLGEREIAEITCRVKTHDSLAGKVARKHYASPLDATDIVGVRVVHLYASDSGRVQEAATSILRGTVESGEIERVGHNDEADSAVDYGYRAIHFVGHVAEEGLPLVHEVPVEIQVRTVGQHAWALLEQGLVYKSASAVPRHLVRNVLGLSILYELADDRFDQLRDRQREYESALQKAEEVDLSGHGIDLDSVKAMLGRCYSINLGVGSDPELSVLLADLDKERFHTIGDIREALTGTLAAADDFIRRRAASAVSPVRERLVLNLALALADPGLLARGWPRGMKEEDRDALSALSVPYSRTERPG
jgi:ppGpp synthetase/RelA/SpoT-type nucleotidyltranferase